MGDTIDRIISKLIETSTMRGIVAIIGAISLALNPADYIAITSTTLAILGAINVVRQEPMKPE